MRRQPAWHAAAGISCCGHAQLLPFGSTAACRRHLRMLTAFRSLCLRLFVRAVHMTSACARLLLWPRTGPGLRSLPVWLEWLRRSTCAISLAALPACCREAAAAQAEAAQQLVAAGARSGRDAEKAAGVRAQQRLWGAALELRIRLQRALAGGNSLPRPAARAALAGHSPQVARGCVGWAGWWGLAASLSCTGLGCVAVRLLCGCCWTDAAVSVR